MKKSSTGRAKFPQEVVLPLPPVPASRPRVGRWGVYYGKSYAQWKLEADKLLKDIDMELVEGPLQVEVEQVCKRPKTTKRTYPTGDVDNHAKGPLDAITRAPSGWNDDDQIVELKVTKRYAKENETPCSKVKWKKVNS